VRGLATYGYRVSRLRNQILTSLLLAIIYLQGPTFLPPSCSPTRRLRLGIMVSVSVSQYIETIHRFLLTMGRKKGKFETTFIEHRAIK
jgi:hypothetical protein